MGNNKSKSKMDSSDRKYLSDKYLSEEGVKEYEAGRPLSFFESIAPYEKDILNEFWQLNEISMTGEHEDKLIPHKSGETSHLNRYSDILPYEYSAVKLISKESDDSHGYINANYIASPNWLKFISEIVTKDSCEENELGYIAWQGPKKNTVQDFWTMVDQQKIGVIVMLCKLKEGGRSKCEQYWPDEGQIKEFDDFKVQWDEDIEDNDNLNQRSFSFTKKDTGEVKVVKQIQYSGWPDHGVPESHALEDFDKLMEYCTEESSRCLEEGKGEKMLFHWSAGIGRTGTLL